MSPTGGISVIFQLCSAPLIVMLDLCLLAHIVAKNKWTMFDHCAWVSLPPSVFLDEEINRQRLFELSIFEHHVGPCFLAYFMAEKWLGSRYLFD